MTPFDENHDTGSDESGDQEAVAAIGSIDGIDLLLQILCEATGMRFAVVARVTDTGWIACAVRDEIQFGLIPGGRLDVRTTFCCEVRSTRDPIVIDDVASDDRYRLHPTPQLYGFVSYISVPIILTDGRYFGNLCCLDPKPAQVSDPYTAKMFARFAQLIAHQLDAVELHARTHRDLLQERAANALRRQLIHFLGRDLHKHFARLAPAGMDGGAALLVDDLMDVAGAASQDALRVRPQEIPAPDALFAAVIGEVMARVPERRIIANVVVDAPVRADPARLRQLTEYLLENALGNGPLEGPVSFIATVEKSDLVIEVWNDGARGSQEEAGSALTAGAGGPPHNGDEFAPGFVLAHRITKAHGGRMSISSSAEDGTQVTVRIPLNG